MTPPIDEAEVGRIARVLVCGGRDFFDNRAVSDCLNALDPRPAVLINGGAPGADRAAWLWAKRQPDVQCLVFNADWGIHGKAAGPIRNQRMLDEGKPTLVVAFPGGRGTADMVRRARAAGVPVLVREG
jgi:hypothetical protein